ncbi:MAG: lysylphosphatidylglycerol synthase domain-containing protein [Gammaproteobacteria bacterium]
MLSRISQGTVIAKMMLAPLGVGALLYWASQQGTLRLDAEIRLLLLGGLLALISVLPFALRLREILKLIGYDATEINVVRIQVQSMFYYFFVPLSVGTELSKFAKLKNLRPEQRAKSIASVIVLDHIVGLGVLIILSIGLYFTIQPVQAVQVNRVAGIAIVVAIMLAAGLGWLYLRSKQPLFLENMFKSVVRNKANLALASCYSLLMHLLIAAAVTAGAINWQVQIGFLEVLFVLTGAFLFQMIPLNVIGVGALEIAGTGLYLAVGLSISEALSLVSLLYCYRILIALVGGVWEFVDAWKSQPGCQP